MFLSCCIWALNGELEEEVLRPLARNGFRWVDVRPDMIGGKEDERSLRALKLRVACVAASFGLAAGVALDSEDAGKREQAVRQMGEGVLLGSWLGATTAYVVPDMDGDSQALSRYAASLARAAERAGELGIRLGIEHFPGRSLPTVAATLDFIRQVDHPNLYLLFDIGHAQISGEDPAAAVELAGDRLAYVHLDDNDGENDLHLGLTEGVLSEETLRRTFESLRRIGYEGGVSLELNANLSNPLRSLERSAAIAEQALLASA